MKIIRLQIPGNILKFTEFAGLFEDIKSIEILKAFQYDQNQFFSLQKIKFKPNSIENLSKEIKNKFNPKNIQILDINKDEITCIMYQNEPSGFFPIIDSGPWAFLFPIYASRDLVLLNFITHEDYISNLFETLSKFTETYELLGIRDIKDIKKVEDIIGKYSVPFPEFTKRQREIAQYAAENGYFESPKKISAKEIGHHFNIKEPTVNKHLRNINKIVMEFFFGKY
ncbi:MAG: helix-turn-helix domain-containing protein [Promethearchaeati archaeon]